MPAVPSGVFACTLDGECPSGMFCSLPEQLCFRDDPSAGGSAGFGEMMGAITAGMEAGAAGTGGTVENAAGQSGVAEAADPVIAGMSGEGVTPAGSGAEAPTTTAGGGALPPAGGADALPAAAGGGASPQPSAAGAPGLGQGGAAACAPNELMCSTGCVPNDARNCGRCGHDCTALPNVSGPVECASGSCVLGRTACAPGWAHCSSNPEHGCEVDITQPRSCGTCTTVCPASAPMCSNGSCTTGCPSQTPSLCSGSCVDLQTSVSACGACDRRCTTSQPRAQPVCRAGSCTFMCNAGSMECAGACVDIATDNNNCGRCGTLCGSGKTCQSGQCRCTGGLIDCNGRCVTGTDVSACGTSCRACTTNVQWATPTCDNGTCSFVCQSGFMQCSGSCVDIGSDPRNCGRCGRSCPGPRTEPGSPACSNGECGVECASGYGNCGDDCLNTKTDPSHCGLCDEACTAGWSCVNFQCVQ